MQSRYALHATPNAVIVGAAGGAAETTAINIVELSEASSTSVGEITVVLDQKPFSPKLLSKLSDNKLPHLKVYFGEPDRGELQQLQSNGLSKAVSVDWNRVLGSSIVVGLDDGGDDVVRNEAVDPRQRKNEGKEIVTKLCKVLPNSVASVICAVNVESEKGGGLFGPKGALTLQKWADSNKVANIAVKYGELVGAVPGLEPLPFVGMPLAEPEMHPSYKLQSLVCSTTLNNRFAATEMLTRDALAATMARLVLLQSTSISNGKALSRAVEEVLLVSIPGPQLTEKDFTSLFQKMLVAHGSTGSSQSELLRVEFGQVLKPQALVSYLIDTWFPTALIDANAATISQGARPVRASRLSDGTTIRIVWEDLQADLTVKGAGSIDLILDVKGSPPSLVVQRNAATILPGEIQLVDKLQEAINTSIYKKQFCTPLEAVAKQ